MAYHCYSAFGAEWVALTDILFENGFRILFTHWVVPGDCVDACLVNGRGRRAA